MLHFSYFGFSYSAQQRLVGLAKPICNHQKRSPSKPDKNQGGSKKIIIANECFTLWKEIALLFSFDHLYYPISREYRRGGGAYSGSKILMKVHLSLTVWLGTWTLMSDLDSDIDLPILLRGQSF